jgi:pimeloyl-ACP methyl ester carboxylesterase
MLVTQGIGTIRMDFLGSGESDLNFSDMTFDDELSCARIILEEVKKMPSTTKIYVLGHSMGGAVASELAKLYPNDISKLCLWAPAFNLPSAVEYLKGHVPQADFYDHNGFQISDEFVKDMLSRDFYKGIEIYKNQLMIIHGTNDQTVPFAISEKYLQGFHNAIFKPIENGSHNYDCLQHIQEVLKYTYEFLTDAL